MTERVPTFVDESRIEVRGDLATLHKSARGSITGTLEAVIGEFVFPGRGWSDFVVVVLGWWLAALKELIRGAQSAELLFMDGPFVICITKEGPAHYTLVCREDRAESHVRFRARVNLLQLLAETENAATRVFQACSAQNWDVAAVQSLARQLDNRQH
jgi:hypothetical protein